MEGSLPHERLNLTLEQFTAYAMHFGGERQVDIAAKMGNTQPAVSKLLRKARRRNPNLPPPPGGPELKICPVSSLSKGEYNRVAEIIGC